MQARVAQLNAGMFEPQVPSSVNKSTHKKLCAATTRNEGYLTPSDYFFL
jgi:hypothetical protein